MPFMSETLGERLRRLRKKSGLTQEQLANLVGVHETTIRRWENEGDKPSIVYVSTLAKALGVSEADLLNEPPPVHKPGEWVINFKTVTRFDDKEVIDLTGVVSPVCGIQAAPDGCGFVIKADWDTLRTKGGLEKLFRQVVRDFYKPIQAAGIAYRKIPDD